MITITLWLVIWFVPIDTGTYRRPKPGMETHYMILHSSDTAYSASSGIPRSSVFPIKVETDCNEKRTERGDK